MSRPSSVEIKCGSYEVGARLSEIRGSLEDWMEAKEKIQKLNEFKTKVSEWQRNKSPAVREWINQNKVWARREVIEAGCFQTLTIYPPPAVGGLLMQNVDPFAMMFDPPYQMNIARHVVDMVDQAIGAINAGPSPVAQPVVVSDPTEKGYAFIAMPIDPSDPGLEDVLDAIKEASRRCGINAERIDEPHSNERITDRILESIGKAEFVIVDVTGARPNVFYEAGYAQGLGKTPIFVARDGAQLAFDLKDYPVIFFRSMKELKERLEQRLRGLVKK